MPICPMEELQNQKKLVAGAVHRKRKYGAEENANSKYERPVVGVNCVECTRYDKRVDDQVEVETLIEQVLNKLPLVT